MSYPSYAQALVTGFRPCSWWLAVPASPQSGLGWALGALMFTVNRTNPVNGILPLTGLIRSTAFPCPPEYRAGQRTSFPFPNTTSKLVGLFSPLCPTPPSFLYIHKKSAWCRTCGGVCCVCCVPPQGPRAPLAPCLGTEALQRQFPPLGATGTACKSEGGERRDPPSAPSEIS